VSGTDDVGGGVEVDVVEVVEVLEVVVGTEEVEVVVEPVEDGGMSPIRLVNPPITPPRPSPVVCEAVEVVVPCCAELGVDSEPLGTKPPRTPRPCLLLRGRWWIPRCGSITRSLLNERERRNGKCWTK
jgi:hypothetical protein